MKKLLVPAILLIYLSPLFFFKLGQSSLSSFDEAWYATIAKNILLSGNLLNLRFNGQLFVDHPPAGFWLMAASMSVFGINEFGVRAASATLGLFTLVLVFTLGKKISSSSVGFASAAALASSPWFVLRARSGNLDVPLTFFFLLTFLMGIYAAENKRWLIPLSISLVLLLLTKTLVPFTILPALMVIFWSSSSLRTNEFFISLILTLTLTLSWFISQLLYFPGFINKYLAIGFPQSSSGSNLWQNIIQTKTYLHNGLGPSFRPVILSLPWGILLLKNRYFLALIAFVGIFLFPFAFSSRGQIWHLIPVHPFLMLAFFTIVYSVLARISKHWAKILTLTLALLLSASQINKNWHEFIDIPAFISDEAILSKLAAKYPFPLVIDENFIPAAVFYSGKVVYWNSSRDFSSFAVDNKPTLVITHQWRLDQVPANVKTYQIIASDRDKVLILMSPLLK